MRDTAGVFSRRVKREAFGAKLQFRQSRADFELLSGNGDTEWHLPVELGADPWLQPASTPANESVYAPGPACIVKISHKPPAMIAVAIIQKNTLFITDS